MLIDQQASYRAYAVFKLEGTHTNPRRIAVNPNLDLWPFNHKTISLVGYSKFIPYTKFEHFGIIRFFELCYGQ